MLGDTVQDTHRAVSDVGLLGVIVVLLRAFSLGGGTYTGIEAVSNGVGILREPRVENGKRTMLYMSASLAFTAGGILLCYLLNRVAFQPGKTLNASLWELLTHGWHIGGWNVGPTVVAFALVSEGALLFVAAQTGFVDGPRTLGRDGGGRMVPEAVQEPVRAACDAERRARDGHRGGRRARLYQGSRRHSRGHVLDQRVPHLHAEPVRHGEALGAGEEGRPLEAAARDQCGGRARDRDDPRDHGEPQVPRGRLGHDSSRRAC
jgi:hypothetical protein